MKSQKPGFKVHPLPLGLASMAEKHPLLFVNIEGEQIGDVIVVGLGAKDALFDSKDAIIRVILNSIFPQKIFHAHPRPIVL